MSSCQCILNFQIAKICHIVKTVQNAHQWFDYSWVTHNCQCIGALFLKCEEETAFADTRHILTYDSNKGVISAVKMRHKYLEGYNLTVTKDGSYRILLPNNISELNQYMCDPLNRKNYLCSDCKSGYGRAIISESAPCVNECYRYVVQDFALSVSQFHSTHSVLSSYTCISSQADLCPSDMLHHVQSADCVGIL